MRIVALLNEDPRNCDGGSRIRDFYLAQALASLGDLDIFAFEADAVADPVVRPLHARLHLKTRGSAAHGLYATASGRMHHEGVFDFGRFGQRLIDALASAHIVYGSMLYAAHFLAEHLSSLPPVARPALVWDSHNVDTHVWDILGREAPKATRAYYSLQRRRAGIQMGRVSRAADLMIACTPRDADALKNAYPRRQGRVITIENGADLAAWKPPQSDTRAGVGDVVTFGGWSRSTNALALRCFLRDVWPEVVRRRSDLRLLVVGRSPDAATRVAVAATENVKAAYDVPDVRPYAWASSAIVVPHRHSPGSKLKVYQALATGRPVIAYPDTARSLSPPLDGEILVAESPKEWASLLDEPPGVDTVTRRQALEGADWSRIGSALTEAVGQLMDSRRMHPER